MSFCADIKTELSDAALPKSCCRKAFAYGLFQCAHAFSPQEISLQTEHAAVAKIYAGLLSSLFESVSFIEQTLPRKSGCYHTVFAADEEDRRHILAFFGHNGQETALRLNRANFDCDACAAAYLRGAFLACGATTDPEIDYHLEFDLPYRLLCLDLLTLLRESELPAKHIVRKGSNVIYLKDSDGIADFLTLIGAQSGPLTLYHTVMLKNIRNKINRQTNCESANIGKTVAAAQDQVHAIQKIEKHGGLSQLPSELQELAQMRLKHPDYSLRELGACLSVPLSRSGVNHRLRRILEWADNLSE